MKTDYSLRTNFAYYHKINVDTSEKNGGPDFPTSEQKAYVLFGFSPKSSLIVQRPVIELKVASPISAEKLSVFAQGTRYAGFTMIRGIESAVTDYAIVKSFSYEKSTDKLSRNDIMREAWEQALSDDKRWMQEMGPVIEKVFHYQDPVAIDEKLGYCFSYKDAIGMAECKALKKRIRDRYNEEKELERSPTKEKPTTNIATTLDRAVDARIQRKYGNLIQLVGQGKIHFIVKKGSEKKQKPEEKKLTPQEQAQQYIKLLMIDSCCAEMAIFGMVAKKISELKKGASCLYYPPEEAQQSKMQKNKRENTYIAVLLRRIIQEFVADYPYALQYVKIRFLPAVSQKIASVEKTKEAKENKRFSPASSTDSSPKSLTRSLSSSVSSASSGSEDESKRVKKLASVEILEALFQDTSMTSVVVSQETTYQIARILIKARPDEIDQATKEKILDDVCKPKLGSASVGTSPRSSSFLFSWSAFIYSLGFRNNGQRQPTQPPRSSGVTCTML